VQMPTSSDPAFTDDTVRGVLNFLLRTQYYEHALDYGVNPITVKRPPPIKKQTMWGEDTDDIPKCPTPATPPKKETPQLVPPLSRPSTTATDVLTTGLPPTPTPFRALDWAHYRQDARGDSSTQNSRPATRGWARSEGTATEASGDEHGENDENAIEDNGGQERSAWDARRHLDGVDREAEGTEDGQRAPAVKRVQESWRGQSAMFCVRELCVQHVVEHMDAINALPMLRFSEECQSRRIKQAACELIFADFEASLASDSFRTLHFRHAVEILSSSRVRVQCEEKVCEAAIGWLETHHYDRLMAELELRDDLEHKLDAVTIPVLDLDRNFDTLKDDVAVLQGQVDAQQETVNKARRHLHHLESLLKDHSEELLYNDQLLLQSARELATYRPEDLLICLYRNPTKPVQMLLEAVALMFGMEPNWLSTRRMCFEGQLVNLMAKYDFKSIKPSDIALVYEYTKQPSIRLSKFKTKPMIALATWLHAASSCVRLVSDMLGDDLGIHAARQVLLDEEAVLASLHRDLDVLANEEENSKLRLRLAIGAQLLARLELDLCLSRLFRDSRTLRRHALALLSCVRWPLLSKNFLLSKVDSNHFIQRFVRLDPELNEILEDAKNVPGGEFLSNAFSLGDKSILSPGQTISGVTGVSGSLGRQVYTGAHGGMSLKQEARILSCSTGELRGSRLGWKRTREFSEARGGKGPGWPKELSITPEATPSSVGTTILGAIVAVSGDWMIVAGGLDKIGRPHSQVLKVKLSATPRLRPIWQKDWEHCAFMSTPRAFANGGVVPAGMRPGNTFDTNSCLIMCGGYNIEGLHLTSCEVAQTPMTDVFFPLPSLSCSRVLGTVAQGTQWGRRKVLLIGGFSEHGDPVDRVETLPSRILFDVIGDISVLPEDSNPRP
jgi:hypothetical protein